MLEKAGLTFCAACGLARVGLAPLGKVATNS